MEKIKRFIYYLIFLLIMSRKNIIISKETELKFNKARGIVQTKHPELKVTDNVAMDKILTKFLGD